MINITIDGRVVKAEKDSTVLEVAREVGIEIPTLCYHEVLSLSGACRLCLVEVTRGKRVEIVTACTYPLREEIIVKTNTERVRRSRRMMIGLLLARCPHSTKVLDMAKSLGVEKPHPRFVLGEDGCILCGLCVQVCRDIVGLTAIGFVNRGAHREVTTPFREPSSICIGCGACAYICPVDHIKMEDIEGTRIIHNWKRELKLKTCKVCGNYFAPEFQLDYIREKLSLPPDLFESCQSCRK